MPTYLIPLHLSTGPSLPYGIGTSSLATSPDGNGVIMFGGSTSSSSSTDTIMELKSDGQGWVSDWTILSAKLQFPRQFHLIIPLLMEQNVCGLDGIVSFSKKKKQKYNQNKNQTKI